MITIATHAARRSSETSETSAEVTSSLSASGSISLPNVVTSLVRRAIQPSSASVKLATTNTIAASRSPLPMPDSSAATSTGTSRIRKTVRRFGTVGSNTRGEVSRVRALGAGGGTRGRGHDEADRHQVGGPERLAEDHEARERGDGGLE